MNEIAFDGDRSTFTSGNAIKGTVKRDIVCRKAGDADTQGSPGSSFRILSIA